MSAGMESRENPLLLANVTIPTVPAPAPQSARRGHDRDRQPFARRRCP